MLTFAAIVLLFAVTLIVTVTVGTVAVLDHVRDRNRKNVFHSRPRERNRRAVSRSPLGTMR
jgi:hypothetical protein